MTIETSVDALTAQTTELLSVCVTLKDSAATLIADAVVVSENAAILPLMKMAENLISTQALLVIYITR